MTYDNHKSQTSSPRLNYTRTMEQAKQWRENNPIDKGRDTPQSTDNDHGRADDRKQKPYYIDR